MSTLRRWFSAWLTLSRPPFHTVGVLPFALGGVVAWRMEAIFDWGVFVWGGLGVVLVLRGQWRDGALLERLCGANLAVNLGTTAFYIVAFVS